MIKIHAHDLKQAGKLLKRLPSHRSTLPVLTHIAAIANFDTLSIVTANLDQRLETRIPLAEPISSPESILIPPDAFQSGNHRLTTRTQTGNYPNWRQVVPRGMVSSIAIAEERRAATQSWLRSLPTRDSTLTLRLKKRGVLQLIHGTKEGVAGTIEVPVIGTGKVPVVSVEPSYLATALAIAPTLWLSDEMSPVVARRPDGAFCVIMPLRVTHAAAQYAA